MKLIMSASRATLGAIANHERTMGLASRLAYVKHDFKVVLGVFEEDNQTVATEVSFMISAPNAEPDEFAYGMARLAYADYQQECVLAIDENDRCYLFYPEGQPEFIGIWTHVDERPAGNATQVDGKWYTAIKGDAL